MIGVHVVQILEFVKSALAKIEIGRWTAVDAVMRRERLAQAGYTDFCEANLEDPEPPPAKPMTPPAFLMAWKDSIAARYPAKSSPTPSRARRP